MTLKKTQQTKSFCIIINRDGQESSLEHWRIRQMYGGKAILNMFGVVYKRFHSDRELIPDCWRRYTESGDISSKDWVLCYMI